MSSPQRHGPSKYEKPEILAIPQEITDIIESHLNPWSHLNSIKALRCTSRTFAEGLLTTFIDGYLKSFTFYLNEQGVKDIERLANSRLATHVRAVELADRCPSTAVLEYRETNDEMKKYNLAKLTEKVEEQKAKRFGAEHGPYYTLPRPCKVEDGLHASLFWMDDCIRSHRHSADFDALYPGGM